jgi:hypothetical protein
MISLLSSRNLPEYRRLILPNTAIGGNRARGDEKWFNFSLACPPSARLDWLPCPKGRRNTRRNQEFVTS